jgi:ADP-ribosylglycohydrolase
MQRVLDEAKKSAEVTHNHPEGIKGAQATAAAVFLARTGSTKTEIKRFIEQSFGYDLNRTLDEIRPDYLYDVSSQGTVPHAIIAFLESNEFEDAIRKAISLGGDSDTLACITGGIAEAFYKGVPDHIAKWTFQILDEPLTTITRLFIAKYQSSTAARKNSRRAKK